MVPPYSGFGGMRNLNLAGRHCHEIRLGSSSADTISTYPHSLLEILKNNGWQYAYIVPMCLGGTETKYENKTGLESLHFLRIYQP